jgi:hypothetical protein
MRLNSDRGSLKFRQLQRPRASRIKNRLKAYQEPVESLIKNRLKACRKIADAHVKAGAEYTWMRR